MNKPTVGRFWAVGVGPGDPELLTLKAVRLIRRAAAVYHAGPADDRGRALEVVRAQLRPDQPTRTVLTASMAAAASENGAAAYRYGVEQIAVDCRQGRDVVFVTEGDPTLYSTATAVWQLLGELAPEIAIEVIPGITSFTAAAARVRWPLARKDETVAVIPAGYHAEQLARAVREFTTVCLLKPAQVLPQVRQVLDAIGSDRQMIYVENLGTERELVSQDWPTVLERKEYFSLLLIRRMPDRCPFKDPPRQGKLWVVGLGPGDPDLLTYQARKILESVDTVVGYSGYLRALAPLGLRAELAAFPLGEEPQRAARALELASAGKQVALVSSGDAGVYGMASVLLELASEQPEVPIAIVPGVTAATAAAALLGAPLGHDFACISLSDLLTPWETIERRLHAAGQGDFVLALYNPVSQRRTWQLPRARDILLAHRRPETTVGLVDRAFRPGTRVWTTTLGELSADDIGMETIILIGNDRTRLVNGRLVTPRGYSAGSGQGAGSNEEPKFADAAARSYDPAIVGQRIQEESYAMIERELGAHDLAPWSFAVVRRMIHASADFEFAHTLSFSSDFETRIKAALQERAPIVTDTEMVRLGITSLLADKQGMTPRCLLNNPAAQRLAQGRQLTRSAAGICLAAQRWPTPIVVIGNAPTALDEALRLVEEEGWRPAAIIGMPVGFVGVEEAKHRLQAQTEVPYLTCIGRKGGSAVAAAAVNALVEWNNPS